MRARRQTFTLALMGGLLVIALALWFVGARARRATTSAVATMETERRDLMTAARRAQERFELAEHRERAAAATLAALRDTRSVTPKEPAARPRLRTQSEIIAGSPALELLELERQRAAVNEEYDRFYRQLGLSPEMIAKFRENRVKSAENWMDFQAAARLQDEAGKKTAAELQARAMAEHEMAQAELLGPDGFHRLEEYKRTIAAHNAVVRGLAGAAALEGVPLTAEQGEQLLAATLNAARGTTARGDIDLTSIDWNALDRQAQGILAPAQFALYKYVEAPAGFKGRWEFELDAAVQGALEAERGAKPDPAKR